MTFQPDEMVEQVLKKSTSASGVVMFRLTPFSSSRSFIVAHGIHLTLPWNSHYTFKLNDIDPARRPDADNSLPLSPTVLAPRHYYLIDKKFHHGLHIRFTGSLLFIHDFCVSSEPPYITNIDLECWRTTLELFKYTYKDGNVYIGL